MEPLRDLLSLIVFFLIWLFPLLFIFLSRDRSKKRRAREEDIFVQEEEEVPDEPVKQEAPGRRRKPDDSRAENFLQRLMEVQGMEPAPGQGPPPAPKQEGYQGSKASQPKAEAVVRSAPQLKKKPAASSMKPMEPLKSKTRTPLHSMEKYPVKQRAVILSEIIGKPKALRDDL